MLLTNIGLVHWHLFPIVDVNLRGDIVGVVGENGAGKSTIIDAMQVIMTGGDQSRSLNKRAAETGSSKRSIHSYSLGRLQDGKSNVRDSSNTYLLAGFEDPKGKKAPCTLMVAIEAVSTDTKADIVTRAVIKGYLLKASDLAARTAAGKLKVEPWHECRDRVIALVEAHGGTVDEYKYTAKEYVKEYMFALFTNNRVSQQDQFITNFLNGIALSEMNSANEFVQKFILPNDRIPVAGLRDDIQTYHEIADNVKNLREQLGLLEALDKDLAEYVEQDERANREKWIAARAKAEDGRRQLRLNRKKERDASREWDNLSARIKNADFEIGSANTKIAEAEAKIRELKNSSLRGRLNNDLVAIEAKIKDLLSPLVGSSGIVDHLKKIASSPSAAVWYGENTKQVFSELFGALPERMGSFASLPSNVEEIDALLGRLHSDITKDAAKIDAARISVSSELETARGTLGDVTRTVTAIEQNKRALSREVDHMMSILAEAGIEARVLADLVEVADEEWADAAEAFLGPNREMLLVAPKDNHRATELLKQHRRDLRNVLIANTVKLSRLDVQIKDGTLASVFRSSDKIALAAVAFRTGGVRLAKDRSDLDKDGRWIMQDGSYDDGMAISLKELRGGRQLGANAQKHRLPELISEVARLKTETARLVASSEELKAADFLTASLVSKLDQSVDAAGNFSLFVDASSTTAELQAERVNLTNEIRDLDDVDVSDYEIQIEELRDQIPELSETRDKAINDRGELNEVLKGVRQALGNGEYFVGSIMYADATRREFGRVANSVIVTKPGEMIIEYIRKRHKNPAAAVMKDSTKEHQDADRKVIELRSELTGNALRCIAALNAQDQFSEKPSLVGEVRPWVIDQIDHIRNETLIDHEHDYEEARLKARHVFRDDFVSHLRDRFTKVNDEIGAINAILKKYPFLNEIYQIRKVPAPAYEAFHAMVKHQDKVGMSNLPLLRQSIEDDVELSGHMKAVEQVLLSEDVDIDAYEDYRRYFAFEIEITNVDTQSKVNWSDRRGTASGGELQTPYYIALMTALSNIYYSGAYSHVKEGDGGLCLAVFDEAFSNMDERVKRQIVAFSRNLGLQLLICGPSGQRTSMERYANTIVHIHKSNNQSYSESTIILPRTHEELADIDPSLLTREGFAAVVPEAA